MNLGMNTMVLNVKQDGWSLESELGVVMVLTAVVLGEAAVEVGDVAAAKRRAASAAAPPASSPSA